MKLDVKHQDSYSRGELLLRTFFGYIYIGIPHFFLLIFVGLWANILTFISFWAIIFTGRYPQSFFEYQVKVQRWNLRVISRLYNLADGYPPFGLNAEDEHVTFEMEYPESLSRGKQILKILFGSIYCVLPHAFVLIFRLIWTYILTVLAWWAVLFTGNYPESWHRFNVGTIRWNTRVNLYMGFMIDQYPPFSGKPDAELNK